MVLVWIHQALTNYLQLFPCGAFLSKGQKVDIRYRAIYRQEKEGIKICNRRGRAKFSGVRGIWGGWIIRWRGISSKSGWYRWYCLWLSLMRTGWEVWGWYKGWTKGDMLVDARSGWASWYLSLFWFVFAGSSYCLDKLGVWGAWPYRRDWLARTGWTDLMIRRYLTGRYKGRAGGLMVTGEGLGPTLLALEMRWATRSGGCHHFHWYYRGCGVSVSVQRSNYNMLHSNPNW